MGVGKTWRKLKVLKAVGQAANEAAGGTFPGAGPQRGMVAGFANVMAEAMASRMASFAERRGAALPGSDASVLDGSAWASPLAAGAAALRARDAAFDPVLLETFAGQVYSAVNAVWMGADAGSVRPVLSDALWEPLAAVTGVRGGRGGGGFMGLGHVHATARLTGLNAGAWYDSALVIMGVSIDVASLPSSRPVPPEMQAWNEDWLFQRSVRPGGDPMIRPPACPSCGAPTSTGEAGECTHCRVPVPFLTTGWLASRIVSHHPGYATARARLAEQVGANPDMLLRLPPAMRDLLAPGLAEGEGLEAPPGFAP
jgi:hypothetical protein